MGITIATKISRNGLKKWYYFEWGKAAEQRRATGMFTWITPKNKIEKNYNKETLSLLDTKLAELFLRALWLQCTISAVLIFTGTFEQILIYCGVLLNITSMFVVAGVFILRAPTTNEKGHNYRSQLFPLFQLFFLLVSL